MNVSTRDNIAKFLYDCGKVTFTVLVVGVIARKPFIPKDGVLGLILTLTFFAIGVIINQRKTKGDS